MNDGRTEDFDKGIESCVTFSSSMRIHQLFYQYINSLYVHYSNVVHPFPRGGSKDSKYWEFYTSIVSDFNDAIYSNARKNQNPMLNMIK